MTKDDCEVLWEYLQRIEPGWLDEKFCHTFPVKEMTFGDWWTLVGESESQTAEIREAVLDGRDILKARMRLRAHLLRMKGSEPTFEDALSYIDDIMGPSLDQLNLSVNLEYSLKSIEKAFDQKVRSALTKRNSTPSHLMFSGQLRFSERRLRHEELRRFLRAYDLEKEGRRPKEIRTLMSKDYPHDDVFSSIRKDINKAKLILGNIIGRVDGDFGVIVHEFPGVYDYTQKRRKSMKTSQDYDL